MDFALAVAVLVPGVLPFAVVDRFVPIKAWQPAVYVVLVRENLGPLPDFLADNGFDGLSLDIVQRTDDYAAATLNHAQHRHFVAVAGFALAVGAKYPFGPSQLPDFIVA